MNGKLLLDTNIVIALFAKDASVQTHLVVAVEVFISSIVLGELYYGARKSGRANANLARIDEFASSNAVLDCDTETAREYGLIKNHLRTKGRPIPDNDIWIAAITQQYQFRLCLGTSTFKKIDGLALEKW